jgi:type IV secretion system protein VirB9
MMKQAGLRMVVTVLAMLAGVEAAYALQEPRAIATEHRLRTVRYSPNEVFKFIGHYGYQSSIEFSQGEDIETISVGDSISWLINPIGNRIFLKPIEQDALTNMTVITSKRTYHFELHARETESINDNDMVFVMRFVYPEDDIATIVYEEEDTVPDFNKEPDKYNFHYSIRGAETISPIRIFDDGEFTYFEFEDKNADVPAFFNVDAAGNEELINFRTRGNYIVVERVSNVMTLRKGPYIVCVYNEVGRMEPYPPAPDFWQRNFGL